MKLPFKYPFGILLYWLGYLIPKSNNIWVFGATGGLAFNESPKYIYNYIYANKINIKAIWLTRNPDVILALRKTDKKVFHINSLSGMWYTYRAKIGVISHGLTDINRYCSAKLKIMQCWHGVPFKPVLEADKKKHAIQRSILIHRLKYILPFLYKEIRYDKYLAICGSGVLANKILKRVFGKSANIIDSGFPRLDGLFNPVKMWLTTKIRKLKKEEIKVGIYIPTYRKSGEFDIISYFNENIELISNELLKRDMYLFVKIHSFEENRTAINSKYERIYFIANDEIANDIYSVLGLFDFIITDYSSVIFDFLILQRPVFILCPDREEYIASNGAFVFDYKELKLNTYVSWEEFFENTDLGREENRNIYKSLSNKIHKHLDHNNTKRTVEFLLKSTNEDYI